MGKVVKKNKAVFSMTENQIKRLIEPDDDAANLISAFMVLACHTDKTGVYSTAGAKAVRIALHFGKEKADSLLERLSELKSIRGANKLSAGKLKENMPQREGRAAVRWVLLPDKSRRVWISSAIVRGFGSWKSPLLALRQCGANAARILLALYLYEDGVAWGGVNPRGAIYKSYDTNLLKHIYDGVHLFRCSSECLFAWHAFHGPNLLRFKKDENDEISSFWIALEKLQRRGFIYECLTIFSGSEVNDDMCLLYPLHTFNKHGHAPKGEESLSGKMNHVAEACGLSQTDKNGRFYGSFAFISDSEDVQAVGVFRLRFRNTSSAFEESLRGWQGIQDVKKQWGKDADYQIDRLKSK